MSARGSAASLRRPGVWLIAGTALALGVASTAVAGASGVFDRSSAASSRFSAGCTAPAATGAQVQVRVTDMGGTSGMRGGSMMGGTGTSNWSGMGRMTIAATPSAVPAGTVTLDVSNVGVLTHEVLVLPLPQGRSIGARTAGTDGRVDESSSLGEVSNSCAAGAGEGIASGATGWTTVTLAPGRYELVCNIPGHYAAGAFAELDVT